jgi:hypothetical protein
MKTLLVSVGVGILVPTFIAVTSHFFGSEGVSFILVGIGSAALTALIMME